MLQLELADGLHHVAHIRGVPALLGVWIANRPLARIVNALVREVHRRIYVYLVGAGPQNRA